MAVVAADIKWLIGNAYNTIEIGTTTTVIGQLIDEAEADIVLVTGTTTTYDQAIKYLAASYTMRNAMAGLGPESDMDQKYENMRVSFIEDCKASLRRKGKDFNNIEAKWKQVNG